MCHPAALTSVCPHLFSSVLHHEEDIGSVAHSEAESVLQRVWTVVVVTDTVLVEVVHAEAAGLSKMLTIAGPFDSAVARRLDNCEDDGLCLSVRKLVDN